MLWLLAFIHLDDFQATPTSGIRWLSSHQPGFLQVLGRENQSVQALLVPLLLPLKIAGRILRWLLQHPSLMPLGVVSLQFGVVAGVVVVPPSF